MTASPPEAYPISAASLAVALRHRPDRIITALSPLGYQLAGPDTAPVLCDRNWRAVGLDEVVERVRAGWPDIQYTIYQAYMDATR